MASPSILIVVPCHNESARLRPGPFSDFLADNPDAGFVFVSDGSTDDTLKILRALAEKWPGRAQAMDLPKNAGKAEAVRRGMLAAFDEKPLYAGFWDADLATPLNEVPRFMEILKRRPACDIVIGARVQLLGRSIRRNLARHYLGRIFATIAAAMLGMDIYDTQCGAKIFRTTDETQKLFSQPFCVSWTFDVEILARLAKMRREKGGQPPEDSIYELPLNAWRDVSGSKVPITGFFVAPVEIFRLFRRYRRGKK